MTCMGKLQPEPRLHTVNPASTCIWINYRMPYTKTLTLLVYQPPSELKYYKQCMHYQAVTLYNFLLDSVR